MRVRKQDLLCVRGPYDSEYRPISAALAVCNMEQPFIARAIYRRAVVQGEEVMVFDPASNPRWATAEHPVTVAHAGREFAVWPDPSLDTFPMPGDIAWMIRENGQVAVLAVTGWDFLPLVDWVHVRVAEWAGDHLPVR